MGAGGLVVVDIACSTSLIQANAHFHKWRTTKLAIFHLTFIWNASNFYLEGRARKKPCCGRAFALTTLTTQDNLASCTRKERGPTGATVSPCSTETSPTAPLS